MTSPFTGSQSFSTSVSCSLALDLSAYAGIPNLMLAVALNWYSNGGGTTTFTCKYNSVDLVFGAGQDRSAGANYGSQLWVMSGPPTDGSHTLACTHNSGTNTGRNIWGMAWLWSNVGSWDSPSSAPGLASGAAQSIAVGTNEVALNAMSAGQTMSNYSQTQRQASTVASTLRAIAGDAAGDASGSKAFSTTGGTYNSVAIRLRPAA
ncbi:hypothetical protein [Mycolicibacterium canariasense]|uniref:hypothetical protein n=1 Tax=Mycolicibacterium canariasense TaxID=228230 RepID=UPI00105419C2|nr:hypothetical protein [Mycolicibacterium canariasense]MCV7208423.1 hypothetical protein [Mycolicibacterium canariasense]